MPVEHNHAGSEACLADCPLSPQRMQPRHLPPSGRFSLQLSSIDPHTCLVVEPDGSGGADVVGSFSLTREDSMAKRLGLVHTDDPELLRDTWRWRVEADEGNSGGGHFA